ncbi:MAG: hypothetical protein PVF95_13260 [bacterium]|jgi:hypothetical protein
MKHTTTFVFMLTVAAVLCSALAGNLQAATSSSTEPEVQESEEVKNTREVPTETLAKGKRGRRLTRVDAWVEGLEGDRKKVFEKYGHPSGRYREETMGAVIETWVYAGANKTFRFKGNRLVR